MNDATAPEPVEEEPSTLLVEGEMVATGPPDVSVVPTGAAGVPIGVWTAAEAEAEAGGASTGGC